MWLPHERLEPNRPGTGFAGRIRSGRGVRIGGLIYLVGLILCPSPGRGQDSEPLVTDRPDQTESAESVPAGSLQLELGWSYAVDRENGSEFRTHSIPSALFRLGLGADLEARVGFAGWISQTEDVIDPPLGQDTHRSTRGAGDAELGLKWGIANLEAAATRIALLGGVTLPIGREGLGSERADPTLRLAVSNDVSSRVSLGYNLGVQWETTGGPSPPTEASRAQRRPALAPARGPGAKLEKQTDLLYTLALGFGLSERVGVFVESFGFLAVDENRPDRHSLDGGVTLLVTHRLQLDASAGVGLNGPAEEWFFGAGLSARFPG